MTGSQATQDAAVSSHDASASEKSGIKGEKACRRTFGQSLRNRLSFFQRHDIFVSVTDEYHYQSANDLNVWNGAALLCADCLGTGLLALPHGITVVLGSTVGLFFLILQLPINLYAGSILSDAALFVENKQNAVNTMSSAENEQQKLLSKEQLAKMSREEAKNYHAVKIDVQLVDDNSLVEDRDEGDEHIHRT
jgi:hypothetical protein